MSSEHLGQCQQSLFVGSLHAGGAGGVAATPVAHGEVKGRVVDLLVGPALDHTEIRRRNGRGGPPATIDNRSCVAFPDGEQRFEELIAIGDAPVEAGTRNTERVGQNEDPELVDELADVVRRKASRTGKTEAEVVELAVQRLALPPILDRLWERATLSEDEAMAIAVEETRAVRAQRRAS